jgi:single-strand DNA-binding protein
MNRVIITGNLTRDIELRYTSSGLVVTEFGFAVNDKVKKGNDWVQETSFFDVVAFGSTAEVLNKYTEKGSPLLIEGRLKQESWTTQDGQKRSKVKVIADRMEFIGSKREKSPAPKKAESSSQDSDYDDRSNDGSDVPF